MKKFQYDELMHTLSKAGCGYRYGTEIEKKIIIYLWVNSGKHEAKKGLLTKVNASRVTLAFDGGKEISFPYSQIEMVGKDGEPIIMPITDMTGRQIEEGSWLCYSQATSYSHALEVGKVEKVTGAGGLMVRPYLRNGEKVTKKNYWGKDNLRKIGDPDKALLLPTDLTTMTMWILKDFTDLGEEE